MTRSRAPARSRGRSTGAPRRRPPARPPLLRGPLLSPAQNREITGIAAIGLGLVFAALLALPGGGVVARPVHDWLFSAFGVGAWAAALGCAVTGVRLTHLVGECAGHGSKVVLRLTVVWCRLDDDVVPQDVHGSTIGRTPS